MKKFISALAVLTAVSVMSANIYAASITIDKAVKTDEGAVLVECTVTDPEPYQELTVISFEQSNENSKGMIYIDQYSKEMTSSDNTYSFEFSPASWAELTQSNKIYIVKIGGNGVEEPAEMAIVSQGGTVYAVGDINGDGTIDRKDAILLLKHISNITKLTKPQIDAGDVNEDNVVDLRDVAKILNEKTS